MNSSAEATANINNQNFFFKWKMKKTASKNNASFIKAQEEMIGQSKTTFFYSFTIIEFLALTLKDDIMS